MAHSPEEINLPLFEGYSFLGWSTNDKATQPEDLTQLKSIKNLDLYAVYKLIDDVHTNVLTNKYLGIDDQDHLYVNNMPNTNIKYQLSGKIVLPNTLNGRTVKGLASNCFRGQTGITHVFLENRYSSQLRYIAQDAFSHNMPNQMSLVYFEMPVIPDEEFNANDPYGANGKVFIGNAAFMYCTNFFKDISIDKTKEFFNAIGRIENRGFIYTTNGFTNGIYITSTMKLVGSNAFNESGAQNIYFGSETQLINLNNILFKTSTGTANAQNVFANIPVENIYVYSVSSQQEWENLIYNTNGNGIFGLSGGAFNVSYYII